MTIDPRTLTTTTTGREGRTRLTVIPTGRADVLVYVTTRHHGKPAYSGVLANAYRASMNVVRIETEDGARTENFAPADAVPVLLTPNVSRYSDRGITAHHARALEVVAAMSDPARRAPEGVTRATITAGSRALASWLRGRITA